jgi:uncharacterized protein involved in exopolysaccharide biosynthesis
MVDSGQQELTIHQIYGTLRHYHRRWIATAAVIAGLVAAYAIFSPKSYEAVLAITVRNEAQARPDGPGKFRLEDPMKTTQQTLVEIASSQSVLQAALAAVGPEDGVALDGWPAERDVEGLREAMTLASPKGAEFGTTEIFYLKIQARSLPRATQLVDAVCRQMQERYAELREAMAAGLIAELDQTVALSRKDLDQATSRMAEIERAAGMDLGALRMLHQSTTGDSELHRTVTASTTELRQLRATRAAQENLLQLLRAAQADPEKLLAAPRELLDGQPTLLRLKQGLTDAQLATAKLESTYTPKHPLVVASRREEETIGRNIHLQLETMIDGVDAERQLNAARTEVLERQLAELQVRLDRLAGVRAEYSNLAYQVENRRTILEDAQRNLAVVTATQATARTGGLIRTVGPIEGSSLPVGPSKKAVVLAGAVGGLLAGWGLVFLTVPILRDPAGAQALPAPAPTEWAAERKTAGWAQRPTPKLHDQPVLDTVFARQNVG